jgi:branched-subunit amino acid transport protein
MVRFYDSEQDRRFCFLSNHLLLPALTICQLYKMRWQVELFFKWIKQHLRIKRFYGNSINAVKTQVWIAVCVYVLVAILKKELQLPQSLHSILQVLSVSVFEKVPINELLTTTLSENYQSPRGITEIESYANFRSSRQAATSSTSTPPCAWILRRFCSGISRCLASYILLIFLRVRRGDCQ